MADRAVWLRVASGVETLSGRGPRVWNEPPAVAAALRDLLSVVPLTHAVIDLDRLRYRSEPVAEWKTVLSREGDWPGLLQETVAAISDAVRGRAHWGLALPSPAEVAASSGDASDRALTKAGVSLASFLQPLREARLDFIAVDLGGAAASDKIVAPLFRNAQMYGWRRIAIVDDEASAPPGADVRLLGRDRLPPSFWKGDSVAPSDRDVVHGEIPPGIDAAAIVAAGRRLENWGR